MTDITVTTVEFLAAAAEVEPLVAVLAQLEAPRVSRTLARPPKPYLAQKTR